MIWCSFRVVQHSMPAQGRGNRNPDTGHISGVNAVAVSPAGDQAVTASKDNDLRVWDLAEGRCLHVLQGKSSLPHVLLCSALLCLSGELQHM